MVHEHHRGFLVYPVKILINAEVVQCLLLAFEKKKKKKTTTVKQSCF